MDSYRRARDDSGLEPQIRSSVGLARAFAGVVRGPTLEAGLHGMADWMIVHLNEKCAINLNRCSAERSNSRSASVGGYLTTESLVARADRIIRFVHHRRQKINVEPTDQRTDGRSDARTDERTTVVCCTRVERGKNNTHVREWSEQHPQTIAFLRR